ncbi:MAG: methyltransferase [Rhodospirillales bacterium]|nr:methyltransferase [Rhodospirillales bacterium]
MTDHESFVRAYTGIDHPPACPELSLYLASEITPLWLATEETLKAVNLPPPFWAFCWVGGQAVARHILDHPELVRGKRVLDFAAGGGVAAIAAAKAGAAVVEAADIDPFAAAAIRLNADLNDARVAVLCADLVDGPRADWDVVVAGDVCYERPMAERVFAWLRRLAAGGALVLMGDPGRNYLPNGGLVRLASYAVPTSRELEDRDVREAVIYRVAAA